VERNVVRLEDTGWIAGHLSFRDAPLARVAAEVERWYGVKLSVADSSLLQRRVTTSFEGQSADKVLQILELALGAKITRAGDSAIISSPRTSPPSR
jgi:ferric-dicitrate binding protein FerR (iron transport regulator)